MKPLRVKIFHTRHPHFGAHSGIQQFAAYLDPTQISSSLRSVQDGDEDLRHFAFRGGRIRFTTKRLVQWRGQKWYKLSDFAAELSGLRAMLQKRVDVIHYVDGEHTAQFLPAVARTLRSCGRTVATYHQTPEILHQVVVPSVVRELDHVTLMSSSQLPFFQGLLPEERVSVILHGVDVDFFRPGISPRRTPVLHCITTGSYLRDWELMARLADIFVSNPQVEFHVVSTAADRLGEFSNVTIHRRIDDDGLRRLYQQADLMVLPLLDATANNALLEGLASGLPIIASDLPSLREYAGGGSARFVPHEPQAFAHAIEELLGQPEQRATMGAASRSRAESLAWPHVAKRYEHLYQSLFE